jgi:hypothetical protein
MGSFWVDFIRYAIASVAATLIPYWMLSGLTVNDLLLTFLLLPTIWIAPAIVLIRSLFTVKAGPVLGALGGIPLMLLCFAGLMQIEAMQIRAVDQRQFLPPKSQHRIVAIENSSYSTKDGAKRCSAFCLQMLFDGRYVPAIKHYRRETWTLFQLAHGQTCRESPRASRYLELLGRRYADACIITVDQATLSDALVIREYFHSDDPGTRQRWPYRGSLYEFVERTDGNETVLGSWARGEVEPPMLLANLWGLSPFYVGDPFKEAAFYSQALHLPIRQSLPSGNAPAQEVLDGLRPFFDDPEMASWAMNAFDDAMREAGPDEITLARQFMQARIFDLKASLEPDAPRIQRFEGWLKRH